MDADGVGGVFEVLGEVVGAGFDDVAVDLEFGVIGIADAGDEGVGRGFGAFGEGFGGE